MESGFIRKPSGLEAFFTDLDAGGSNMTIHFYLELTQKPDVEHLREAMRKLLDTHKGANMRFYKNAWYTSSHDCECPVIDVEGRDLSSYTPARLDYRAKTVDVKVLHATVSDAWYLGFDFFHGVMDGRSAVQFMYDFFDVLNGREYLTPEFKYNVYELLKKKKNTESRKVHNAFTVFSNCAPSHWRGKKKGKDKTITVSYEKTVRGISAHYARTISQLFKKRSAKMIIPVDARRYMGEENKSLYGNLFVPLLLDTAKYPTWAETQDEIWHFVKHRAQIRALARQFNVYRQIPTKPRQFVIRKAIPWVMSRKKFVYCALVSSLGVIDSRRLSCDAFEAKDCSASFISFPFAAFTVVSLQYNGRTNTSISWHSGRVPQKTVNELVSAINECMKKAEAR